MFFPLSIAVYTAEVTHKAITTTFTSKCIRVMVRMIESTLTLRLPGSDIKSFSTWQPILTQLFWPSRYELELFTWTISAFGTLFLSSYLLLMMLKEATTEAHRK